MNRRGFFGAALGAILAPRLPIAAAMPAVPKPANPLPTLGYCQTTNTGCWDETYTVTGWVFTNQQSPSQPRIDGLRVLRGDH